jgi:hypothetical protein
VVVALPLDVQVSTGEWAKYGEKPTDMSATLALERDLMETAALLHIEALDVTTALAAAEPGAFLYGDIHMTPKGHDAVAAALALYLQTPKAAPATLAPLPPGRSAPPTLVEWEASTPLKAKALPKGCSVRAVREWVRLFCGGKSGPSDAALVDGGHGEAMLFRYGAIASLLAPAMPGESLAFEVSFGKARRRFVVRRDGDDFSLEVKKLDPGAATAAVTPNAEAACACSQIETGDGSCGHLLGAPDSDCARTYAGDCKKLLRCLAGEPSAPPVCLPDWTNAGGARHCFKRCETEACSVGTCTSWQGARVCMGGGTGAS